MKIPHKHAAISVRNPQAARPRSRSALQQANTLRRSEITNFRVSSALECLAHVMEARWRQDFTRGDRCPRLHAPPNGFHFDGNWVLVWLFFRPRVRGSQGTSPFEFRQYRQTRFGYARSKRSRPQFKAHNSVRPFENGLRSLGSSATRPRRQGRRRRHHRRRGGRCEWRAHGRRRHPDGHWRVHPRRKWAVDCE